MYKKIILTVSFILPSILLTQQNGVNKVVFGYLPDWVYQYNQHIDIQYDLLTHLAVFPFTVDNTGNISYPYQWEWEDVVNKARQNNVKIIMSVAEFDSNKIAGLFYNETVRMNFLRNLKIIIRDFEFDGVNIDFENLRDEDEGDPVVNFMIELTDSIRVDFPLSEISFATPAINWNNDWKLSELSQVCDYLFIMGYGFYGEWSRTTGPVSPLTGGYHNLQTLLERDYSSVDPSKIILGLPYYGEMWMTKTNFPGDSVLSYQDWSPYSFLDSLTTTFEEMWSNDYNVSWYRWQVNDSSWTQLWLDNRNSLSIKFNLINERNLLGLGIWALGYDYPRTDLWQLIREKFASPNANESTDEFATEPVLINNYPNPFNPSTKIQFYLAKPGAARIIIYDMKGEEINSIVSGYLDSGWHEADWDARNFRGEKVSSGIYVYQLVQGDVILQRKMIVLK